VQRKSDSLKPWHVLANQNLKRGAGLTLTFKNDAAIFRRCVQLHEEFVQSLKGYIAAEHFKTLMFFQPLPSYLSEIGEQRGGNMLGLEDMENAVVWTGSVGVDSGEASLAVAQARLNAMTAQIKDFAESVHGVMDLVYLNYADASQNPLGSYGADQVRFLHDVAARYDPTRSFQTRVPGGFKIGRVA
jgi:hypothetical protein